MFSDNLESVWMFRKFPFSLERLWSYPTTRIVSFVSLSVQKRDYIVYINMNIVNMNMLLEWESRSLMRSKKKTPQSDHMWILRCGILKGFLDLSKCNMLKALS